MVITGFDLRNVQMVMDAKQFKAVRALLLQINLKQAALVSDYMAEAGFNWSPKDLLATTVSFCLATEDLGNYIRADMLSEEEITEEEMKVTPDLKKVN